MDDALFDLVDFDGGEEGLEDGLKDDLATPLVNGVVSILFLALMKDDLLDFVEFLFVVTVVSPAVVVEAQSLIVNCHSLESRMMFVAGDEDSAGSAVEMGSGLNFFIVDSLLSVFADVDGFLAALLLLDSLLFGELSLKASSSC